MLFSVLTGCSTTGGGSDTGTRAADPGTQAAAELSTAQLVQFGDAKVLPERSEEGIYSQLATVQRAEKLRESAEVDKPECLDAANRWGRLPEVREAPASLATFAMNDDVITHMLVRVPEETAQEALTTVPTEKCSAYEAVLDDGTTTSYTVRDIDMDTVGDDSRAFLVETEADGDPVRLFSLIYYSGGHMATTTVLSSSDGKKDILEDFSRAALERENEILG